MREYSVTGDPAVTVCGESQTAVETVRILQSARPWTRADALAMVEEDASKFVPGALRFLEVLHRELGTTGQGVEWEQAVAENGVLPHPSESHPDEWAAAVNAVVDE